LGSSFFAELTRQAINEPPTKATARNPMLTRTHPLLRGWIDDVDGISGAERLRKNMVVTLSGSGFELSKEALKRALKTVDCEFIQPDRAGLA
jgi:hypothetical protein